MLGPELNRDPVQPLVGRFTPPSLPSDDVVALHLFFKCRGHPNAERIVLRLMVLFPTVMASRYVFLIAHAGKC